MNGTLEKLSRELSLNVSSDYIRNRLEAYGVFSSSIRHSRKSVGLSPASSLDPCSPERRPSDLAVNGFSPSVRTTQLVYYVKDGKEYRGLCEPRTVPYNTQHTHSTLPMWPVEVDCVNFRPKFIQNEPEEREPLYFPDAPVPTPPLLSADRRGHVVYMNQPSPAQWFTRARQGPSLNCVGFTPRDPDDISLSFESRFESGNLSKAVQVGKWEYELHLRPDLYTGKHTQWFYFGVRNMRPGRTYQFTIVNFYKAGSLYNKGMRPLMYSERQAAKGVGWRRVGSNIKYFKTNIRREGVVVERFYYALTWTCRFPVSGDTCYFAHCYPYTYTDLKDYLQKLMARSEVTKFCKQRTLCHTIAGNPVPVLTIAAPSSSVREAKAKKAVVITARVHPGESNASWMMKGLLDFLTSSHSDAKLLREMFVFKVVPMLNPDGVIIGNYRCSLTGRDLNRNYHSNLKEAYPSVWYVKAMVQKLANEREVVMYCDLHGHSRKQDVFIYGCLGLPGKDHGFNLLSRVFPKMMSLNIPDKFSYKYSTFSVHKSKEGTGRVALWRQMGILNSFTMEATFCGSNLEGKCRDRHFTSRDFESMGYHLCDTLLDYCDPDQSNVEFVLHGLREERRKEIIEHLRREGVEIPADTDPLDLEDHMPHRVTSNSDEGSDSSVSDGAPLGHFSLEPSVPEREEERRRRTKRRKPKGKRSSVHQIPKMKMAHSEAVKSHDDPDSPISGAPSMQSEPIPMETKLKCPSAQTSRPAGAEARKDSATSSVSVARDPTPTVQYKHRLSTTGGVPIYVQERLEERQRRRSDAEGTQPAVSGFGSEASVYLEPSWSLQRLQNMAPASLQDFWKSYNQPLTVSSLLPQKADGVEDGPSHFPSDKSLPQISPSHLHHSRGADNEMMPTDSAHLMANQMREIMERCNLPLNPTNNLVSLSRFFRQTRPLGANRKVYMDMVKALRRPALSHSTSQHQADGWREERGVDHYHQGGEGGTVRQSWSGEGRSRSQLAPPTEEVPPRTPPPPPAAADDANDDVENHPTPRPHSVSKDRSHDRSHGVAHNATPEKDSLPCLPLSRSVISAKHSRPDSDVTLEGTSEGIPDDVIDNSEFTLEVDERGYDSDSESGSDDGDNPVDGTSEPHPPSSALPRNTSEKTMTCTLKEITAPIPKSFSVPYARLRTAKAHASPSSTPPLPRTLAPPLPPPLAQTTNTDKQGCLISGPQTRPQSTVTDNAGVRLGSALIRGPDVRRHKDKVAAAVEALEDLQQTSERLTSCKPRRQDPYSSPREGPQQREMGVPTAVLFAGPNLIGADPLRTTEQSTSQGTTTTSTRDPESTQPNSNPLLGTSQLRWQKPPPGSQAVDRGERLPHLVSQRSDLQFLPRGRQGGERGESARAGVWPSVSCEGQPSRPVTRGCFGRPSTSMGSSLQDGGVVPKPVTLDLLPPRVLHTSHSRTRPAM